MATRISIKNVPNGYQSIISNGKHAIVGDEPVSAKGTDLGMTPTQLVLAGISMCKVATIRSVARRKGIEIGDVDAELKQVSRRDREGNFRNVVETQIKIEGDITEAERAMLIAEADNCYVTRMIKGEWDIQASTPLKDTPIESPAISAA